MHKAPYVFPVIGGRKIEHLQANIEALSVSLTSEQIGYIDGILPFDVGFPSSLVVRSFSFFGRLGYMTDIWAGEIRHLLFPDDDVCNFRSPAVAESNCAHK
jgi:hypothetical protein